MAKIVTYLVWVIAAAELSASSHEDQSSPTRVSHGSAPELEKLEIIQGPYTPQGQFYSSNLTIFKDTFVKEVKEKDNISHTAKVCLSDNRYSGGLKMLYFSEVTFLDFFVPEVPRKLNKLVQKVISVPLNNSPSISRLFFDMDSDDESGSGADTTSESSSESSLDDDPDYSSKSLPELNEELKLEAKLNTDQNLRGTSISYRHYSEVEKTIFEELAEYDQELEGFPMPPVLKVKKREEYSLLGKDDEFRRNDRSHKGEESQECDFVTQRYNVNGVREVHIPPAFIWNKEMQEEVLSFVDYMKGIERNKEGSVFRRTGCKPISISPTLFYSGGVAPDIQGNKIKILKGLRRLSYKDALDLSSIFNKPSSQFKTISGDEYILVLCKVFTKQYESGDDLYGGKGRKSGGKRKKGRKPRSSQERNYKYVRSFINGQPVAIYEMLDSEYRTLRKNAAEYKGEHVYNPVPCAVYDGDKFRICDESEICDKIERS